MSLSAECVFVALVLTGALVPGKVCSVLRSLACTDADTVLWFSWNVSVWDRLLNTKWFMLIHQHLASNITGKKCCLVGKSNLVMYLLRFHFCQIKFSVYSLGTLLKWTPYNSWTFNYTIYIHRRHYTQDELWFKHLKLGWFLTGIVLFSFLQVIVLPLVK